jgi:hypothetical protein
MIFYSVHFNRPDFIKIQKECVDRIGGKLVVVKNSNNPVIDEECKRLGVSCYSNPRIENSSPSHSHGSALNFITEIIDYSDDWCTLDHDFFPLKEIKFEDYDLIGLIHGGESAGNYLWPGFMAGKKSIPLSGINFLPSPGRDTGSGTSVLLSRNYKVRQVKEDHIGFKDIDVPLQKQSGIVKFEDFGIHYLNGSGWMPIDEKVSKEKISFLQETINLLLLQKGREDIIQ